MEYTFQKLTPASDADIRNYEEALEFIFREKELKNIAISGSYGAGKSSIIESYKEKHKDVKFLHVSLARFKNLSVNEKVTEAPNSSEEKLLEGKVINQLIHQIDMGNIPLTNFQIKREPNHIFLGCMSFLVTVWIVSIFYIMDFDSWKEYLSNAGGILEGYLQFTLNDWMPFVAGVVNVLIAGFALYYGVLYQQRKGWIRKINIADNEIELFDKQDESLFDRYLDEVLYIFRNANVDVIVFEDIDRYESAHIFQQLREINRLVNIRKENNSTKNRLRNGVYKYVPLACMRCLLLKVVDSLDDTRPLKFFYLLKDDILTSKERTKFFDYILPVVPVLDGSNSYDKMIDFFKLMPSWKTFDPQFLQEVSFYIDDMRLLKNIANEFFVYSNNIITTEQDSNKLLAMIIYKNIFPRDFSNLQLSRGFVYNLFAQKDIFLQDEVTHIKKEIEKKIKKKIKKKKLKKQFQKNNI